MAATTSNKPVGLSKAKQALAKKAAPRKAAKKTIKPKVPVSGKKAAKKAPIKAAKKAAPKASSKALGRSVFKSAPLTPTQPHAVREMANIKDVNSGYRYKLRSVGSEFEILRLKKGRGRGQWTLVYRRPIAELSTLLSGVKIQMRLVK